jgi:hypothetical protein
VTKPQLDRRGINGRSRANRIQQFAALRERGLSVPRAASEIGVSARVGTRYSAALAADPTLARPPSGGYYASDAMLTAIGREVRALDWLDRAGCGDRGAVMAPRRWTTAAEDEAREVCLNCPVMQRCEAWVMGIGHEVDPGGMVAAMTEVERNQRRIGAKRCRTCKQIRPGTDYAAQSRTPDGLKRDCRPCDIAKQQTRKAAS